MARALLTATIADQAGNVAQNALVTVYEEGTTTPVADMFSGKTGGSPITTLLSDAHGQIVAWFTTARRVDLLVTDNTHAAFRPGSPTLVLTWPDYTKTVLVEADPVATQAAIDAAQPLDSDLTAIAALSTTSYGRAFLALADAAAGRTALGLGTAATAASSSFDAAGAAAAAQSASQPLDSDLTAIAALSTTSFGRAFLALADAAAGRTALGLGTAATTDSTAYAALSAIRPTTKNTRASYTMLAQALASGHGWAAGGGNTATLTLNDTGSGGIPVVVGTQYVKIVTNGAGGASRVDKTGLTVDMTAKSPVILIECDDMTHLDRIEFYMSDDSVFTNFTRWDIEANTAAAKANRFLQSGKWQRVSLQYGDDAGVYGGTHAPRAGITTLRINVVDDNTGNPVTVRFAQVLAQGEPTTQFPNGVVSFTFDDIYASTLTGIQKLDQYGYPSLLMPIIDVVGTSGHLTLAQMQQVRDYSQADVGAHSYTSGAHNSTNAFIDQADGGLSEMQLCRKWLMDNGFWRGADFFAYPQGKYNDTVLAAAQQMFTAARTTNPIHKETWPPGDRYRIRTRDLASGVSLAQAKVYIDTAKTNKGWIAFTCHKLGAVADTITWVDTDFYALVDYCNSQGVAVRSPIDVINTYVPVA